MTAGPPKVAAAPMMPLMSIIFPAWLIPMDIAIPPSTMPITAVICPIEIIKLCPRMAASSSREAKAGWEMVIRSADIGK